MASRPSLDPPRRSGYISPHSLTTSYHPHTRSPARRVALITRPTLSHSASPTPVLARVRANQTPTLTASSFEHKGWHKVGVAMATPHGRVLRLSLSDSLATFHSILSLAPAIRASALTAPSIQADSQSLDSPSFQSSPKRKHRFAHSPLPDVVFAFSLLLFLSICLTLRYLAILSDYCT